MDNSDKSTSNVSETTEKVSSTDETKTNYVPHIFSATEVNKLVSDTEALSLSVSEFRKTFYTHESSRGIPIFKMKRSCFRRHQFRSSLAPIIDFDVGPSGECESESIVEKVQRRPLQTLPKRLCKSVFENRLNYVSILLDVGVSPNCFDEHERTPLHLAVSKGYCEMVQLLLNRGADPNLKDGLGNSCLHLAACMNNVEMALILIKGGASVNSVDIRGRSPVQLAQSKLRILQQSPNALVKSKVTQIIDMLLLYLEKGTAEAAEAELLSSFQNRLQITESPEQISNEIDNLSKVLDQMGSLALK